MSARPGTSGAHARVVALLPLALSITATLTLARATHVAAQACAHAAPACTALGFARGATTVVPSCRGLSVAGCLACDEGPDVLCTQLGLASGRRPTHGFAIADGRHEALLAWAIGDVMELAIVDERLNVAMVSPPLPLVPTGSYDVVAVDGGFLLALVARGRAQVAPLDLRGALRGSPVDAMDVPETATLALVPFGDHALLVAHVPGGPTDMRWLSPDGRAESPAAIATGPTGILHGVAATGARALIVAYRADGARPQPGDVLVAWSGAGAIARGTWQSDQAFGGIGTIEGTREMDVLLPDAATPVLRVRMQASPTGTLDEVLPQPVGTRGRARRFVSRAPSPAGLYAPTRPDQPPILDRQTARLRSLGGTLSVGFVPAFFPDAAVDPTSEDHGAQIPLALSRGPRDGPSRRGARARRR